MNILSLFDGMSCGHIALDRAGIKVDNYFASEIDKYAQIVSQKNYPNIIRLGDVRDIDSSSLPKIDMIIGGSPCQSFSFAGKKKGMSTKDNVEVLTLEQYLSLKDDGFEFSGQSYLFWEYVRILKELSPKYFLLENVRMLKKWSDVISKEIGICPIMINSNLVSAQNRRRNYWTNIPNIQQPEDKQIYLSSIIENGVGIKYNRIQKEVCEIDKAIAICASDWKGLNRNQSQTAVRIKRRGHGFLPNKEYDANKTPALFTGSGDYFGRNNHPSLSEWRRLTPVECERLQTIPEDYTSGVSNTQRYKMIGNGWTVDVIAHIFSYLPKKFKINK
jgi:DNA (cytosine-5)-methyltransferase 3A